jgi:hypothetical protein
MSQHGRHDRLRRHDDANEPELLLSCDDATKMDTNCTALSLIPTGNGNTVRSFYCARTTVRSQGSSTKASRSGNIHSTRHFDSLALQFGPEMAL